MSGFEAFDYGVQIYGYPEGTQWDVVATKWTSHTLRSFVQVCIVITGGTEEKQTDTMRIREKPQNPQETISPRGSFSFFKNGQEM